MFAGGMAAATAAGMVSAGVASLAEGVSKTMVLSKLKIVGGLTLAGMLTLGTAAVAAYQVGSKGQDAKAEKPANQKAKMAEKGPKLDETMKAAEAYLALLDQGKYAESWDAMSAVAHKAIARAGWAENVGKVRTATGKLKGRKLKRLDLRATGAADRFNQAWFYAEFRAVGGETWSELVILTLEKGKDWKIDTYVIGDPTKIPQPPRVEIIPCKPSGEVRRASIRPSACAKMKPIVCVRPPADRTGRTATLPHSANTSFHVASSSARFEVTKSKKRIVDRIGHGQIQANSADAPSKDGVNASVLIFDELHRFNNRELWDVLEYAGISREQPLKIVITTAGEEEEGPWFEQCGVWREMNRDDPCYMGLDLSDRNDLTALIYITGSFQSGFNVGCRFWLPRENIAKLERQHHVP